jgi:hypothetical protein
MRWGMAPSLTAPSTRNHRLGLSTSTSSQLATSRVGVLNFGTLPLRNPERRWLTSFSHFSQLAISRVGVLSLRAPPLRKPERRWVNCGLTPSMRRVHATCHHLRLSLGVSCSCHLSTLRSPLDGCVTHSHEPSALTLHDLDVEKNLFQPPVSDTR